MDSLNIIMCFVIPFVVIGSGIISQMAVGTGINKRFGYRTKKSKLNKETWKEANTVASKYLKTFGLFYLAITVLVVIVFINNTETALLVVCILVIPIYIIPIYLTEKHLKITFDNNGKRLK